MITVTLTVTLKRCHCGLQTKMNAENVTVCIQITIYDKQGDDGEWQFQLFHIYVLINNSIMEGQMGEKEGRSGTEEGWQL